MRHKFVGRGGRVKVCNGMKGNKMGIVGENILILLPLFSYDS
jgi:hypothetical protein